MTKAYNSNREIRSERGCRLSKSLTAPIKAAVASVLFLTLTAGCANLVVERLKTEPAQPIAGSPVTLSAAVRNKGWFRRAGPSHLLLAAVRLQPSQTVEYKIIKVPPIRGGARHFVVSPNWLLTQPGGYFLIAVADFYDEVHESDENDNTASRRFRVAPGSAAEGCILPIPQADIPRVTGGEPYQNPFGTIGINFAFDYPTTQYVDVVAPCGGTVTAKDRDPSPTGGGREIVSVNIKGQGNPPLNMFITFDPDSTDATTNDEQYEEVTVVEGDVVARGQPLGRLVVRDEGEPEWYPVVTWSTFYGEDTSLLLTDHECPRDFLTPAAQAALDQLFQQINQQMDPSDPGYPVLPVCQQP